jgi:hypothetical protein
VQVRLGVALEQLELGGARPAALLADGTRLQADRVFWAAGLDTFCRQIGHPVDVASLVWQVPMVMHYFVIRKAQEGPYSYVHDFDRGDLVFRASVPGRYGRANCPEGYSYVCCEIPTLEGSPTWADAKGSARGVYDELLRWGVVSGGEPADTLTLTLKATYRVPRAGFAAARAQVLDSLPSERVAGLREHDFAKTDIVKSVRQDIERHSPG